VQGEAIQDALQVLSRALSLAEPEGYMRTFLDEGEEMARLLYKSADRGYSPAYVGRLLAEFSDLSSTTPGTSDPAAEERLVEPLSERELQVLALVAEGLSNREIAGRLYISLSTVKGHIANIYGKLGVNNRTQAAARGRSLGILSAD
jgi:LuxR family maltose regulon positive regulatory protein